MMSGITFMDRAKASLIVARLRQYHNVDTVARMLGITHRYVSTAEYKTPRKGHDGVYVCSTEAIAKILEFDRIINTPIT